MAKVINSLLFNTFSGAGIHVVYNERRRDAVGERVLVVKCLEFIWSPQAIDRDTC